MYQTGYLATRPRRPASLGIAIALHGAALTALLLYRADVLPPALIPFKLIPITPEAKPIEPKPIDHRAARPTQQRERTAPLDTGTNQREGDHEFVVSTGGALNQLGNPGSTVLGPVDPVRPDPVIVDASPAPGFARSAQPPYPPGLQRAEIEGSVMVRIQIDVDGRVIAVEQVRGDRPEFFAATRDWALRNWRFRPATRDGVPVVSWRTMTVHFRMNA